MAKQSALNDEFHPVVPSPVYVKIFKGWDTGGRPIYERRCFCSLCAGLTAPIHGNYTVEEDECQ